MREERGNGRKCSPECSGRETEIVKVKIQTDLACDGKEKWKEAKIDHCVADIVRALQQANLDMRGSCCGHGHWPGYIALQDGRCLLFLPLGLAEKWSFSDNKCDPPQVLREWARQMETAGAQHK